MEVSSGEACSIEDCAKPAHRSGMCRGHYTRQLRGRPVHGPLRLWGNPKRALMEAAFAFADASELDDDAFFFAWKRLYATATRVRGKGRWPKKRAVRTK